MPFQMKQPLSRLSVPRLTALWEAIPIRAGGILPKPGLLSSLKNVIFHILSHSQTVLHM